MKDKDFKPLIMWLCLVAGIIVIASIRPGRMASVWSESTVDWDFVFIGLYLLWMLIELRISRKDVGTGGKKTADFATCQLYGFGQALTILTALWSPPIWPRPHLAHLLGMSLFGFGICYRLWAIRTLGPFYSHRVQTLEQHQIVASGPYRFTRHPAYAGMIVANAGITMYFFNWVTVLVFLFVLLPTILLRIAVEERTLFRIDGYAEFATKRRRLFPAIW